MRLSIGGNFGVAPNPPQRVSSVARRFSAAAVSVSSSTSGTGASAGSPIDRSGRRTSDDANWSAMDSARSRSCDHVRAIVVTTWEKLGIPSRGSGGKYVPAKNGRASGVVKTLSGHPPCPRIAISASM